ncbi:MAG: YajQ family cyclic di-GMP-binding protein [Acidobacteriota bacterium]
MSKNNSFDVACKIDLNEVHNAVNQTMKEVRQRFDFKGSASEVALEGNELALVSEDEYRLRALIEILEGKLVKRGVALKALSFGKVEPAAGGTVRQRIAIQQGIPVEKAKEIIRFIKDTKLKVQPSIQGDAVRVSGRDRDVLQQVIARLKEQDFGIEMQFTNYRSY